VAPGQTINSYVYFTPAFSDETINDTFSGDITATTNVPNGLGGFTPVSYPISGTGIPLPVPLQLVAGQVVSLTVTQGDFVYGTGTQVYYNYYTVT
jgi:Asp-tRNA(Asn)/Glu-tRNA(Gln) amidotransferase A subunit family amidase